MDSRGAMYFQYVIECEPTIYSSSNLLANAGSKSETPRNWILFSTFMVRVKTARQQMCVLTLSKVLCKLCLVLVYILTFGHLRRSELEVIIRMTLQYRFELSPRKV